MTEKELELFERYQYLAHEKIAKYAPEYVDDEDFQQEILTQLIEYIVERYEELCSMKLYLAGQRLQVHIKNRVKILSRDLKREQGKLVQLCTDFDDAESDLDPFVTCTDKCLNFDMARVFGVLTYEQQLVLAYRFGFISGKSLTLDETAEVFGKTRERIRQIEMRAIRKLRGPNSSKVLKDYYT